MPWRELATRTHPDNLRVDKNVISFLQEYFKTGKPVGVICHGP
jgi:protease I